MTDAGTIGVRTATRRAAQRRIHPGARVQFGPPNVRRANLFVAVCALAGVILPTEVQISLGDGARFTAGRVAAALLLLPALFVLLQKGRRFILCDFFAFAVAAWMIFASISAAGVSSLSAAGGDALDFLGGYLIARAFFFGRPALDTFVRVLKAFAVIAILFAIVDSVSGRLIVHETIASIVHAPSWPQAGFRNNSLRAASTFDHEILFGVFCALTGAILLYWEQSTMRRILAAGVCYLGCMLSLSSAALMAFLIALTAYSYDRAMSRHAWRWVLFWTITGTLGLAFSVVAANPLGWALTHLTLDPQTGYFRMMIWEAASYYISSSPLTGHGYQVLHNDILDSTVDSIWVLYALRFGIPMVVFFFLANVTALLPSARVPGRGADNVYLDRMRHAFTLAIVVFMFTGITVHFWNYMLMFWGLCIGVRASLGELSIEMRSRPAVRKVAHLAGKLER